MYYFQLKEPLQPKLMDLLLEQGYYRMRQTLFTTSATINDDGLVIHVIWARVLLGQFAPGKLHRELTRRNRQFTCTLQDASIDEEIEALYAIYAKGVNFDAPESASAFLIGESEHNYFPGKMWQVRDGERLIAVGYFDEGEQSAAGILNFYHPEYKKFSLGKWLYLESVRYATESGKKYFYPGYIALGFPKFDYKLLAGKERVELWDMANNVWVPYAGSIHAQQFL